MRAPSLSLAANPYFLRQCSGGFVILAVAELREERTALELCLRHIDHKAGQLFDGEARGTTAAIGDERFATGDTHEPMNTAHGWSSAMLQAATDSAAGADDRAL